MGFARANSFTTRLICLLAALAMLASLCLPTAAIAAGGESGQEEGSKVVRVGYLGNAKGYEMGNEGEYKSGWGFEYLQTLSYHTGWTYEYVYGDFNTLITKLQAGEIDLMANISYTEERAKTLAFSSLPQGKECYYVYLRADTADNRKLSTGNPDDLAGMTVGVIKGLYQTNVAKQWFKDKGVHVRYKEYTASTPMYDDLESGKIDALVANDTMPSPIALPVDYIGESNYFFAMPKDRQDLIDGVNNAMSEIQRSNPRYNDEVKARYAISGGGSYYLTGDEQSWLASHDNTIRLGYQDNALPYSNCTASGELQGAITALISELESTFNVSVATQPFANLDDMKAALEEGSIDVAAPVGNDFWLADQNGLAQSEVFATTSLAAAFTNAGQDSNMGTIACTDSALLTADLLHERYPNHLVRAYATIGDCMDALASGEVQSVVFPATSMETVREAYKVEGMRVAELPQYLNFSAATARGDSRILNIVNKAIANSTDAVAAATLSHYSYEEADTGFIGFVKRNIVVILSLFLGIFVIAAAVLFYAFKRARRAESAAVSASAAKSNFLSRMSHDIRTPLNGIVGLIDIADMHPDDSELLSQNRKKERVAADHLLSLINDVLEMTRIEDKVVVLEQKPFNIAELIDEVLVLTRLRASENAISMEADVDDIEAPDVIGSPVHVKRVFLNLLENCVKYNKPCGSMSFAAHTVGTADGKVTYRFEIADTGIGMAPDFVEHIFEPFSQASDDARSTYQGTGLGMSIVKGLVDKMGGTIEVQSELGVGTVFMLELAFDIDEDPVREDLSKVDPASVSIDGMKLLLVEDNELNSEIASTILTEEGAVVTCAWNGKEGLDLFLQKPAGTFDAVLMDIMMPIMDGYEASRQIRLSNKQDAQSIPIIAMTANAFAEDVEKSKMAGMNVHMAKPVDMGRLKVVLARYRA